MQANERELYRLIVSLVDWRALTFHLGGLPSRRLAPLLCPGERLLELKALLHKFLALAPEGEAGRPHHVPYRPCRLRRRHLRPTI
eukprot:1195380-Prorocentrum_minimum.AAC.5